MARLTYHLLNVFTLPGDALSGNPLCVFEDGSALSDELKQKIMSRTDAASHRRAAAIIGWQAWK